MAIEYISREAAIALTDQHCFESGYDAEWMEEELKGLPSADVVEVVRCKDCKYYNTFLNNGFVEKICENHSGLARVLENGFCNYGERRTE